MPGPIQTIPQGLLGLLQLKQTGRNPSDLLDSVQSIVDLMPLWLKRNTSDITTQSVTRATNGTGFVSYATPIVVPPGFTWFVENYTITCIIAAADSGSFVPGLKSPNGLSYSLTESAYVDVITAQNRMGVISARNFWVGPGEELLVGVVRALAATTITITGSVKGIVVPI